MPLRAQPTLAMSTGRSPGATRTASLAQILEHLGTTVLELVTGDPDQAGPAREVAFFDPSDPAPVPRGAILLGTGGPFLVTGGLGTGGLGTGGLGTGGREDAWSEHLIGSAVAARASAVILPAAFVRDSPATVRAAADAGLVLLALSAGTTWQQLSSLLESALRETVRRPPAVPAHGEGLFRLANAICTLIGAPVTIEDRNANVLAFSDRQEEADFIRIDCILGRRTIEPYLRLTRPWRRPRDPPLARARLSGRRRAMTSGRPCLGWRWRSGPATSSSAPSGPS